MVPSAALLGVETTSRPSDPLATLANCFIIKPSSRPAWRRMTVSQSAQSQLIHSASEIDLHHGLQSLQCCPSAEAVRSVSLDPKTDIVATARDAYVRNKTKSEESARRLVIEGATIAQATVPEAYESSRDILIGHHLRRSSRLRWSDELGNQDFELQSRQQPGDVTDREEPPFKPHRDRLVPPSTG